MGGLRETMCSVAERTDPLDDAAALRALLHAFVRSFGLLASETTPCGEPISVSHAHALMFLLDRSRRRSRPTQQELGDALGIDKSNVTRLCRRMEQAGHLAQERCAVDGRARRLNLTDQGKRLAGRVESSSRERYAAVLSGVPRDARSGLLKSLRTLNAAVARVASPRAGLEAPR